MFIFPSNHSQNINQLTALIAQLDPLVPGYHVDIMDGHYVPHTMGSVELTHQIRNITQKQLWAHLMVHNPISWIKQLQLNPGDIVSVHYETITKDYEGFIKIAEHKQLVASLAINPETPIRKIIHLLPLFNHILLMSVNPGASGQAFILGTFEKINELIDWQKKNHASLNITVDGGVNESNIKQLKELNVTAVAVTNGLFNNFDPIDNFNKLKKLTE